MLNMLYYFKLKYFQKRTIVLLDGNMFDYAMHELRLYFVFTASTLE